MGEADAGLDEDAATRVESATDLPSAASIREARRPASELIRERLVETGDGGRLGRYLILRLLGEGGMGMVFAAYDEDLDRRVAIKLLRTDRAGARVDSSALLAEAKAMARLSHPNVVQIYDVGQFDEQVFVAMELVNGASLRDWLRERSRGAREIVRAFVEAGRGLQAVHDAGLVHREHKPPPRNSAPNTGAPPISSDPAELRGRACPALPPVAPRFPVPMAKPWQRQRADRRPWSPGFSAWSSPSPWSGLKIKAPSSPVRT